VQAYLDPLIGGQGYRVRRVATGHLRHQRQGNRGAHLRRDVHRLIRHPDWNKVQRSGYRLVSAQDAHHAPHINRTAVSYRYASPDRNRHPYTQTHLRPRARNGHMINQRHQKPPVEVLAMSRVTPASAPSTTTFACERTKEPSTGDWT